ncbi:hypothetical protein [Gordonia sp. (in: high G+C Gram-positive bacteria)]|uniref:hypothetical protein n=1 Tax=Gordonia sp. (in: high G+C Gram-positive bacteria) TaxID=84139 RepID=UPI003C7815E1
MITVPIEATGSSENAPVDCSITPRPVVKLADKYYPDTVVVGVYDPVRPAGPVRPHALDLGGYYRSELDGAWSVVVDTIVDGKQLRQHIPCRELVITK